MEFTLIELHLDDASLTSNMPFLRSGEGESAEIDVAAGEESGDSGGRPSALPFVVGLVFLVGIGLAVRRFMGGSSEPGEDVGESTAEPITA